MSKYSLLFVGRAGHAYCIPSQHGLDPSTGTEDPFRLLVASDLKIFQGSPVAHPDMQRGKARWEIACENQLVFYP